MTSQEKTQVTESKDEEILPVKKSEDRKFCDQTGVLYDIKDGSTYKFIYKDSNGINFIISFDSRDDLTEYEVSLYTMEYDFAIVQNGDIKLFTQSLRKILKTLRENKKDIERLYFSFHDTIYTKDDVENVRNFFKDKKNYSQEQLDEYFISDVDTMSPTSLFHLYKKEIESKMVQDVNVDVKLVDQGKVVSMSLYERCKQIIANDENFELPQYNERSEIIRETTGKRMQKLRSRFFRIALTEEFKKELKSGQVRLEAFGDAFILHF